MQVKRLVEAEVDEPQQGSVELGEGGHDPVVHVCWVLGTQRCISSVSAKTALTTHVGWGLRVPKDQELLQGGPAFGALPQEKRLCGMALPRSILGTSEALDKGPKACPGGQCQIPVP